VRYSLVRSKAHNPLDKARSTASKITRFALLLFGVLMAAPIWGQRRFEQSKEIGVTLGMAYYKGDINPDAHLGGRLTMGYGGFYRHNFSTRIGIRINYFQGRIEAWDADSPDAWQQNRNLHFRNDVGELSALFEINYLDHQIGNPGDRLTAFLYTGIAVYTHMPEAKLSGQWTPLQPLGTEGQGTTWGVAYGIDSYGTTGISVPFGFGFKSNIGPFTTFNIDWGVRKTWTDYLDDVSGLYADRAVLLQERGEVTAEMADRSLLPVGGVSNQGGLQRGDPSRNDVYAYITASLSFRISKKPTTCWSEI